MSLLDFVDNDKISNRETILRQERRAWLKFLRDRGMNCTRGRALCDHMHGVFAGREDYHMDHIRIVRRGTDIVVMSAPYSFYGDEAIAELRQRVEERGMTLEIPAREETEGVIHTYLPMFMIIVPEAVAKKLANRVLRL